MYDLIMPFSLTRCCIEGYNAVTVQLIACIVGPVKIAFGLTCRKEHHPSSCIHAQTSPYIYACPRSIKAGIPPGIIPIFPWMGDSIEAPLFPASHYIKSAHNSPGAPARTTHYHYIFINNRSCKGLHAHLLSRSAIPLTQINPP